MIMDLVELPVPSGFVVVNDPVIWISGRLMFCPTYELRLRVVDDYDPDELLTAITTELHLMRITHVWKIRLTRSLLGNRHVIVQGACDRNVVDDMHEFLRESVA